MGFLAAAAPIIGGIASAIGGAGNKFTPLGSPEAFNNYNAANTGMTDLASQLRAQAQGAGPNLANQLLQNATAQNVANQAALQAGQRGASSNVGLMARQIAQQGAGIQQQAAGQAAQNRLQEQLASQGQLANLLGTQAQLGAGVLNQNNQIASGVAAQNAKANAGAIGGIGGILGGLAPALGSSLGLGGAGSIPSGATPGGTGQISGMNYGQSAKSFFGLAEGGQVPQSSQAPQVDWRQQFLVGAPSNPNRQMMAQGGLPFAPHDYRQGGNVVAHSPKEKAVKPGNDYANDKIPAMLSEGEIVLPRSVTQTGNPQAAAKFMADVMAGKHRKKR